MKTEDQTTSARRVIIVGGGIAGMSFAIALRRIGYAVTLVEQDPEWRVYGAGISITGPTYRAFRQLGILPQLAERGFFVGTGLRICAADGTFLADLPDQPIEPDLPVDGGIMRPDLHAILSNETRGRGVDVRLGVTVADWNDDGHGVTVRLSDGSAERADLLCGADGVFSTVRQTLFPQAPEPAFTGQYCWRVVAPRPDEVDRAYFFVEPDIVSGLMPVSNEAMYMWLLENRADQSRVAEEDAPARLRELMKPFGGIMGRVRDGIAATTEVNVRPLVGHLLPAPWFRGRVILIGDAAHGTTPHLASGAGMAVEDALVLADELDRAGGAVAPAFGGFMARRFERCRLVVENSIAIGRMQREHASSEKLGAMMGASKTALLQPI